MTDLNVSCTMVKEVVLPQGMSEISEKAFYKRKTITVSGWKDNKVILRKLKKDRYRIKVRTYTERNGKIYYSKYSKVYKLKI